MHESRTAQAVLDGVTAFARRWRIIVPFIVVTPLVVFALTRGTPATYESSADVLIDRKGYAISDLRDDDWYQYDASRAIRTLVELARLPGVQTRVYAAAAKEGLSASGLYGRSAVWEDGLTDLMTFVVWDADPDTAERLATIYAEQYVAHRRALDTQAFRRALAVVDEHVAKARATGSDPIAYADLVKQQQQLNTGLAAVAANTRLVRAGSEATRVPSPVLHDMLTALVLGLVVGLGLAGIAVRLDARAGTADEISERLGLPTLGRLPLERRDARKSVARALRSGSEAGAEAVHMFRAAFDVVGGSYPVVMVTSAVGREGKTTTAASLAVSLALAGRDVVLVDVDLRSPDLSRIFDLPKAPGIIELVRGVAKESEVAHHVSLRGPTASAVSEDTAGHSTGRGTLRVVPAGNTLVMDHESIVATTSLRSALESLRASADVVLVDTMPILRGGDALAISAHVDAFILVAQTKRYRRRYARELARFLSQTPATPLGLVVVGDSYEIEPARAPYHPARHEPRGDLPSPGRA